ncbi:uncharacterized protein EAF01_008464 [Botrytis porri]|uniref:Uncharacterized protein n=1 Tax=Botrytis porri TaxID=87229 RepID=A0A4Z1KBV9_9HELO|nr:uncharacterized protein EAF01_008464 [Botrytis porri]KAF7899251.1 hypothetical protein EAF01_008464 [Botrytis porri]TGO82876.1 hypothetical protein BPOR_0741g00080 [Botrytis porri]
MPINAVMLSIFKLINTTTPNLPATPTKASTSSLVSFFITGKIQSTSKMCIHKRMIFIQCGHTRWGSEVKACNQKLASDTSPTTSIDCDTMYSHPMHTVKITEVCKTCEIKRSNTDRTTEKLKKALKDIRESVTRMEKMQRVVETTEKAEVETAKKAEVDTDDDEDLAALESWD